MSLICAKRKKMEMDGREELTDELSDYIWLRLALAFAPAIRALGWQERGVVWVMEKILKDVKEDIAAHVLRYDVRRREEEDE